MEVRQVTPGDHAAVATSLGRAFSDDPVWSYLLPDRSAEERGRQLQRFFRVSAHHRAKRAGVWCSPGGEAAAIWAPPGTWRTGRREGLGLTWAIIRAGGLRTASKVPALRTVEEAHPRQPHWYLEALGTDPGHQGKGLASGLLGPALERCDTEGWAAYLESSKPTNVAFYERFGFAATGEIRIPRGGPTLVAMWREPQ